MTQFINKALAALGTRSRETFAIMAVTVVVASTMFTMPVFAEEDTSKSAETGKFTVTLIVDGEKKVDFEVSGGSVQDILRRADVELGWDDEVSPPPDTSLSEDTVISVERRQRIAVTREEEVPFDVQEIPTSLLEPDKSRLLLQGEPGLSVKTYSQYIVGGQIEEETLVNEEIVRAPVPQQVLVGEYGVPVSPLEFDCEMDENGVPVGYTKVLHGQRATGYSAREGAGTASGRPAVVGHVAVNPRVIPYGTKLYIRDAEGEFIYGYAIAADTGIALMDGRVNVDLFYGTYLESCLNGVRWVDIYILE